MGGKAGRFKQLTEETFKKFKTKHRNVNKIKKLL